MADYKASFSIGVYKWIAVVLAIVSIVLGYLVFRLYSDYRRQWNELSDLNGFIMIDAGYRREFKSMEISALIDCLQYVDRTNMNFEDPQLDAVANYEKKAMASDILQELRQRTGASLGDNPEDWFKKYGYGSTNTVLKPNSQP
jgi:hypothetical protein